MNDKPVLQKPAGDVEEVDNKKDVCMQDGTSTGNPIGKNNLVVCEETLVERNSATVTDTDNDVTNKITDDLPDQDVEQASQKLFENLSHSCIVTSENMGCGGSEAKDAVTVGVKIQDAGPEQQLTKYRQIGKDDSSDSDSDSTSSDSGGEPDSDHETKNIK